MPFETEKDLHEFRLKEFEQLKQEILSNQTFVSQFGIFGVAACLAFIAAINQATETHVKAIGAGTIPFLAFVLCNLILRKFNRSYVIGAYIRFVIEPTAGIGWEAFNAISDRSSYSSVVAPRDLVALTKAKIGEFFSSTASNMIAVFIVVQLYCVYYLCRLEVNHAFAHWPAVLIVTATILMLIVREFYMWWTETKPSEKELARISLWGRRQRLAFRYSQFLSEVKKAKTKILLLDYDGTLSPKIIERSEVVMDSSIKEALRKVVASGNTRVIIVSGRPLSEIVPLIKREDLSMEIWGGHGRQLQTVDGSIMEFPIRTVDPQIISSAAGKLRELVKTVWRHKLVEDDVDEKPGVGSVALHWRRIKIEADKARSQGLSGLLKSEYLEWQIARIDRLAKKTLQPLIANTAVSASYFEYGIEYKILGRNKGDVVRDIMLECEEDVAVAYLGDDRTDEDAFKAIGMAGLSVLVGNEPKVSDAQIQVAFPFGVADFLNRWKGACDCP